MSNELFAVPLFSKSMLNNLSSLLRSFRQHRGLNQIQVAEQTGLSKGYIYRLETGGTLNPSPEVLKKFANCYQVSFAQLLDAAGKLPNEQIAEKLITKPPAQLTKLLAELKPTEIESVKRYCEFLLFQRSQK